MSKPTPTEAPTEDQKKSFIGALTYALSYVGVFLSMKMFAITLLTLFSVAFNWIIKKVNIRFSGIFGAIFSSLLTSVMFFIALGVDKATVLLGS